MQDATMGKNGEASGSQFARQSNAGLKTGHCTREPRSNQRQIWLAVHLPLILSHRERRPFDRDDVIESHVAREKLFPTTAELVLSVEKFAVNICRWFAKRSRHKPALTGTRHVMMRQ